MKAEGRRLILVHLLLLVLLYEIMFVPNQRPTVRDYDALLVGIAVIEALFLFALWYCKRRGTLSTGPFDIILAVWLLMIVWELTTSVLNVAHPVLVPCPENVFDTPPCAPLPVSASSLPPLASPSCWKTGPSSFLEPTPRAWTPWSPAT